MLDGYARNFRNARSKRCDPNPWLQFDRGDASVRRTLQQHSRTHVADFDDYQWLILDPAAAAHLAAIADDPRPELQQLEGLRKALPPERARLLIEQVALRRRAVGKYGPLADRLYFTPLQLEQATDSQIAAYKASRFRKAGEGCTIHDYCCGTGGDLMAFAAGGPAVGWDLSPVACLMAEANLRAALEISPRLAKSSVQLSDVSELTPSANDLWHVDPDRRADGRRSTTLEHHAPSPAVIDRWRAAAPDGAVKLAPACEPPEEWLREGELEWITSQRECRQLVVWFGRLATSPGQRRATMILPTAGSRGDSAKLATATFAGDADVHCRSAAEPRRYLYDPDPSIIAAHLLGALAERYGLESLGAGSVYLTGKDEVTDPLLSSFEVVELLPLRTAAVAKSLAARGVGRVEVKKRGVATDPEKFRRELKLHGDGEATLFLTRIGKRQVAIIAKRLDRLA